MSFLLQSLARRALIPLSVAGNASQRQTIAALTRSRPFVVTPSAAPWSSARRSLPMASSLSATRHLLPSLLLETAIWLIKRTFQPSIIRKKRKMGFLVRQRTVGGRRTLDRRRHKGRMRLGGGI